MSDEAPKGPRRRDILVAEPWRPKCDTKSHQPSVILRRAVDLCVPVRKHSGRQSHSAASNILPGPLAVNARP